MHAHLVVLVSLFAVAAHGQTTISHYRVVHEYPHDPAAFTQGLEFHDGYLYEGTGLEGRSSLRKVQLETGKVVQRIEIAPQYFGEGITILNKLIIQLTWQAHRGFVYDEAGFRQQREFEYPGEGWGLTNDGTRIYMSDGTAQIRVWDGKTLKEIRRMNVHDGNKPVLELNELEWVKGEIYANIWQTDRIARISPVDGRVIGWIDMTGLLKDRLGADVLNGIAYDSLGKRLFVTGKLWPKLFEIQIVK